MNAPSGSRPPEARVLTRTVQVSLLCVGLMVAVAWAVLVGAGTATWPLTGGPGGARPSEVRPLGERIATPVPEPDPLNHDGVCARVDDGVIVARPYVPSDSLVPSRPPGPDLPGVPEGPPKSQLCPAL